MISKIFIPPSALFLLIAVCVPSEVKATSTQLLTNIPVHSYTDIDINTLNSRVTKNSKELSPLMLGLLALEISSNQMKLIVMQTFSNIENRTEVKVTLVREGFLDDAVRGVWNELEMVTNSRDEWVIIKAKKAYLCQRQGKDYFQSKRCL